ncbi:hypothetical protein DSM43518_02051 [Mycobacterium marinum]|uniref:hypothetical protein n=1 Tax=Mycobacterium marinum TaxID=1781 RepID=UPI000EDA49BD|nr:hypothetical protein [Mycobacterium marinum]RFZ11211.1 hypothetical protein DSM43518_02051 [Mycobacterium marinum]
MVRVTGKDHARINLDIWGDEDWLDLTPPAQHLYFVLWTSPQLSYCGTGEWHPGKIAAKAKGWTADAVDAAGIELSRELFLLIDIPTEEFILRSWIKHDGLWKSPNMAVSMVNARADLASRTLRGVIVHEVSKLKERDPQRSSWEREAVAGMLKQKAIDPSTLDHYPGLNPPPNPTANPWVNPPPNPHAKGYSHPGANPPPNPGPTPAPAPTSITPTYNGGYVTGVPHHGEPAPDPNPPTQLCSRRPHGPDKPCRECRDIRKANEQASKQSKADEATRLNAFWAEVEACTLCDPRGNIDNGHGQLAKCAEHDWGQINAR